MDSEVKSRAGHRARRIQVIAYPRAGHDATALIAGRARRVQAIAYHGIWSAQRRTLHGVKLLFKLLERGSGF